MCAGVPCGSTIVHGEIPWEVAYITTDSPRPYLSAIFGDNGLPTVITRAKLVDIAANLMLYSTLVNNLLASLPPNKPRPKYKPNKKLDKAIREAVKKAKEVTDELAASRRISPESLRRVYG